MNEEDERLYKLILKEDEIDTIVEELQNLNNSLRYDHYKVDYEKIYSFCYRLMCLRHKR